ncbi:MAG: hypothetical protein GY772_12780 [bacterium]|nr:hypothetical protein [bacterium]
MTDSKLHKTSRIRVRSGLRVGLVLATALATGACSANLTGFEFPRFGLLDSDAQDERNALPPDLSGTGSRLTVQ